MINYNNNTKLCHEQKLGIYIHWPFCQSICPYCDFNSYTYDSIDHDVWGNALLQELRKFARLTPDHIVHSIFFGGGTPSLMSPHTVDKLVSAVHKLWNVTELEVSLEANPSSVESRKFVDFCNAGVNRFSIGVQSFDDNNLKRLGRLHSGKDAIYAIETALSICDNVSFDMIYSLPGQTISEWYSDLQKAFSFRTPHLSLYELTIEENTRFFDMFRHGTLILPEETIREDMHFMNQDLCRQNLYIPYEVSNFASEGKECKHNMIYWQYFDYIGCGPGAHGRITINNKKYATLTKLSPDEWLSEAELPEINMNYFSELSQWEQTLEFILLGLRLSQGIELRRYSMISGDDFPLQLIEQWQILGLAQLSLSETGSVLQLSPRGISLLNTIIQEYIHVMQYNS